MNNPRHATNATGTRTDRAGRRDDGNATRRHDVGNAPIEVYVAVLDQGYPGGPGGCPADCRQHRKWTASARSRALFVQSPTEARCFGCGRTWTLWALRAHVLGDARLARRVARELAVTS
jgi:hypothetical protein